MGRESDARASLDYFKIHPLGGYAVFLVGQYIRNYDLKDIFTGR
jgi:hypothetical protein